jgi:hypothetical protein
MPKTYNRVGKINKKVRTMKTMENKIIVAFHVGRGGRFYNSGFKTFLGELDFQDLQNRYSDVLYTKNRDDFGRFQKPVLCDSSGKIVSYDDTSGLIGQLDFDGDYDTAYCRYIEDCTDEELRIIAKSNRHKSQELVDALEELGYLIEN